MTHARAFPLSLILTVSLLAWPPSPSGAQADIRDLEAHLVELQENLRRLEQMQAGTQTEVMRLTQTLKATEEGLRKANLALGEANGRLRAKDQELARLQVSLEESKRQIAEQVSPGASPGPPTTNPP